MIPHIGRPRAVQSRGNPRLVEILVAQQIRGAGAQEDADPRSIRAAVQQARIAYRFRRRVHPNPIAARPAPPLERRQRRIDVLHRRFGGEAAPIPELIEQGRRPDPAFACRQPAPRLFPCRAQSGHEPDAGNGDPVPHAVRAGRATRCGASASGPGGRVRARIHAQAPADLPTVRSSRDFPASAIASGRN